MGRLQELKLSSKFLFGIGIILLLFWSSFAVFLYTYLRNDLVKQSYEKTDILMGHINATMHYVKDKLRPKMFEMMPKDEILREAMSTTFINKAIMKTFNHEFPKYTYRRVSPTPLNPENKADDFEAGFIDNFNRTGETTWKGTVKRKGNHYFVNARAVFVEKECVTCHKTAKLGEIIGIEYVSIPVDDALKAMKRVTISIFLIGVSGMVFLFIILNVFIDTVVVRPVKKVSSFFKSVVNGEKNLDFSIESKDEIGEMVHSFNTMMAYLKESDDKLRASESKYRHIFEGSKDAIIVTDCEGDLLDVNPAGRELFGEKVKSMDELFINPEDYIQVIREMNKRGFVKDYETSLKRPEGKNLDVLITANYRLDESFSICGYEFIIKDITERKWMEQQLRQSERLASLGKLAAGVAHEINNPLSVILGYTKLLMKNSPEDSKGDLEKIYKNAQACKKIVDDLLHFSRRSEPHRRQASINELLDDVLSSLTNTFAENKITIEKSLDSTIPNVVIDTDRIRQVFMNLLMNASQAISSDGVIKVSTTYDAKTHRIQIAISDNGCGIPKESVSHIFDPFFTTRDKGTGLGLSVSYGIIKEHGGEIFVTSEVGKGTTFTILLPASEVS